MSNEPEGTWKIQISPKMADGTMINIRAMDAQELEEHMDLLIAIADKIAAFPAHFGAVLNVGGMVGGTVLTHDSSPASPAPAPQEPAVQQSGPNGEYTMLDRYANTWTYNKEGAPVTPRGPAVHKDFKSQAGKQFQRWEDPAKGPKWFADKNPKVDEANLYPGEWAS